MALGIHQVNEKLKFCWNKKVVFNFSSGADLTFLIKKLSNEKVEGHLKILKYFEKETVLSFLIIFILFRM